MIKKIIGVIIIILGFISCSIFFNAGSHLTNTGSDMGLLKSQSGTSLAEVYYQDVGEISNGLGMLCHGFGMGTLTISIGLGVNIFINQKENCEYNDLIETGRNYEE